MEDTSNLAAQIEEVEAMSSIYAEDWVVESEANRKYVINIDKDVRLKVRLTDGYPSEAPPYFELDAIPLSGHDRNELICTLNSLYADNMGDPILYIWTEACKEFVNKPEVEAEGASIEEPLHLLVDASVGETEQEEVCPDIFHDEPITDRKSTFQAHVAKVVSVKQVLLVMETLLSNKKLSAATHNIQAYRIELANRAIAKDYDDDGETNAGERLLHLLNVVGAVNVLVVVSRWYGGIKLGPDRFKHINNCARNVLEKRHFITIGSSPRKASSKKSAQRKS